MARCESEIKKLAGEIFPKYADEFIDKLLTALANVEKDPQKAARAAEDAVYCLCEFVNKMRNHPSLSDEASRVLTLADHALDIHSRGLIGQLQSLSSVGQIDEWATEQARIEFDPTYKVREYKDGAWHVIS